MSDLTFGTWSAAASPLTIEYSLVVIEEIRHEVAEGFQKLSRGGIEVGGLLYGVREGQTVRIMAIRPVTCEHAAGPAFRLSEKDRAALQEQIRQDQADPRLEDLVCLGWYVSHTRTEVTLTESDQEIFSSFFAQPWQVTLVVRPSRGGNMRAGFFVWESGGSVNASQSYLEFSFPDRLAGFDHRADRRGDARGDQRSDQRGDQRGDQRVPFAERGRQAADRGVSRTPRISADPDSAVPGPITPATPAPAQDLPRDFQRSGPASSHLTSLFGEPVPGKTGDPLPSSEPAESAILGPAKTSSGKKWLWLVAALIIIAGLAVTGTRFVTSGPTNQAMMLSVLEREGQLDIEWNRQSAPIFKAVRGTLEIADGPQTRTIPLKPADLALGKFSYKRDTGDIQVRMMVESPDGQKAEEASRFLGSPPHKANDDELKTLQKRKDELDAEIQRLKQSNDQQAQRIQQLERTLKILQTRPGN
jgi:proteasome lid subunit RPN8/RPN11